MFKGRRNFLRKMGVGLLGSAGLLLPGAARAGWCRGRRSVCYPVPPGCAPMPFAPVFERPRSFDPVTIISPSPNSPGNTPISTPGIGFFCAWGKMTTGVSPITLYVSDNSTPPLISTCNPVTSLQYMNTSTNAVTSPPAGYWGYSINGCPGSTSLYLVFVYTASGTETQTVWGPYQFT
jgi:hypothetical protein